MFLERLWNFIIKIIVDAIEQQQKAQPSTKTYLDYDWSSVIEFETGGRSYYEKFLKTLTWPKGQSGITMGIGADLGYMTKNEFKQYFSSYFTEEENTLIESVIGLKGTYAKSALPKVKHIKLSWENASEAFLKWTLPKFWKLANEIWPGLDQLNEKAQVALVSIVFNRGASVSGSSRMEMKNIQSLVAKKDYKEIANQIRSMKRLWVGKNLDGLLVRREKEALMVEDGLA
jgi:GH24 family phage-related lysozyme (muramidase)